MYKFKDNKFIYNMIYITYNQNSGGRSGHVLCDIFTCFVLSSLLDIKVLYHSSWNKQMIISEESLKKHSDNFSENFDITKKINNIIKWDCLSWKEFIDIKNIILNINHVNDNVLIELSNTAKIHPHIVYDWYVKKYINKDIYHSKILPNLHKLYYYDHNENIMDCISIHIRCGDLYHRLLEFGFTFDYYKNIIETLNLHFEKKINIYCENSNYKDIYKLKDFKNVEIHIGGVNDFNTHFNCLVNSNILILSSSSMSLFASYLCKGLVLIDNKSIEFRNNLFHSYNSNLIEKFDDINEKIELIKKFIENKVHS